MENIYKSPPFTGITTQQRNIAIPTQIPSATKALDSAQPAMTLMGKTKILTRFLIDGASLPSFLQQHGRILQIIAGSAAVAGGILHFLRRYQNDRSKIQLAVWHIVRLIENIPDLDAQIENPQELISSIDKEVSFMIDRHLITKAEAVDVLKDLKRKVWEEIDIRSANKRQKGPVEEESASNNAAEEDTNMTDIDQDTPSQPSSPTEGVASPQGPFSSEALFSPTPAPRPLKLKRPRNLLEAATTRASQRPIAPRGRVVTPPPLNSPTKPVPKMAILTRKNLPTVKEGISPQRSPGPGISEYRVAESRQFYGGISKDRKIRRNLRDMVGINVRRQLQDEYETKEKEMTTGSGLAPIINSPVALNSFPLPSSSPAKHATPEMTSPYFNDFPTSPLEGANFSPLDEREYTPTQTPKRVYTSSSPGVQVKTEPGLEEVITSGPSKKVKEMKEIDPEEVIVTTIAQGERASTQPPPSTPFPPSKNKDRKSRSRKSSSAPPTPGLRKSARATRFTGAFAK